MPIKRNKNIVPLSREHHATLLFCWKLKSGIQLGIDPERIQRYVNYFYEHELLPHFKKEEDFNEKKFISLFKHKEFNSKDLTDLEIPKIVLDFDISNALNTHEDLIIHLLKKDDYSEAVLKIMY